jgi:hypothetical protein
MRLWFLEAPSPDAVADDTWLIRGVNTVVNGPGAARNTLYPSLFRAMRGNFVAFPTDVLIMGSVHVSWG